MRRAWASAPVPFAALHERHGRQLDPQRQRKPEVVLEPRLAQAPPAVAGEPEERLHPQLEPAQLRRGRRRRGCRHAGDRLDSIRSSVDRSVDVDGGRRGQGRHERQCERRRHPITPNRFQRLGMAQPGLQPLVRSARVDVMGRHAARPRQRLELRLAGRPKRRAPDHRSWDLDRRRQGGGGRHDGGAIGIDAGRQIGGGVHARPQAGDPEPRRQRRQDGDVFIRGRDDGAPGAPAAPPPPPGRESRSGGSRDRSPEPSAAARDRSSRRARRT